MTRSRVCPDTGSTGLSPAPDALPVRETAEQFAQAVFGKSLSLLTPEERFTTVYTASRDRSVDRHPAGWFPAGTWFYHERRACGGLCRTSSGRATVSRSGSGTAARIPSTTARHARDRSGRTVADPDGRTVTAATGILYTGFRLKPEMTPGKKHDVPEDFT